MKKKFFFASLLIGACLAFATPSMAQNKMVKLTTAKEIGQPINFFVNHNSKGVTIDWGDGQPQTYTTKKADGICHIEGSVKGKVISISGNANWTMLSCQNCGLTSIDLSQAQGLVSLYCPNNQLTSINLKGMTKLADLDCSNNKISRVLFTQFNHPEKDLESIENINFSNNNFSGKYKYDFSTIKNLNISNNRYTSIVLDSPNLKSLDCSNNNIVGTINLNTCTQLENLVVSNNNISSLVLAEEGKNLKQLFCDNNNLYKLQLTNAADLMDLDCHNNNITQVNVNEKTTAEIINVSNNAMGFSALPPKHLAPKYISFEPQAVINVSHVPGMMHKDNVPYAPIAQNWSENKTVCIDLSQFCNLANGRSDVNAHWFSVNPDGSETEMVARTSSSGKGDVYNGRGYFAFYTPQKKVYGKFTSKSYGFTITCTPFAVGDDITAVDRVIADGNELTISVVQGNIQLNSATATAVNICTIEGKPAWQQVVSGQTTVSLPKGVYIVNGKKIIL